jgi:hypothetical protein
VRDDFDTWWIMMEDYIRYQLEKFPNDERTIDWIGSLVDRYALAWHIQLIKGTICGKHPKSLTSYIQALKLRFEDEDVKDEACAELEIVQYDGCIRDMFTNIQMHNDKALVSRAVLKKIIHDRLPHKILVQMHRVNVIGNTEDEISTMSTNSGSTAEKWDEAKNKLRLRKSITDTRKDAKRIPRFERETRFEKPKTSKNSFQGPCSRTQSYRKFKPKNKSNQTYAEVTEGMDKSELDRMMAVGECQRCAGPGDRKGAHKTIDCFRWAKNEVGTAPCPNAMEYQKLKIGAYGQKEDSDLEIDLYTTDYESNDNSGSEDDHSQNDDEDDDN